jgi:excisionase family DNA binding protein
VHVEATSRQEDVMKLDDLPPTLTIEQAGQLLGISRRSAYRAAATGQIPTLRLGRRLLVPTPRLLQLLGSVPEPVG